MGTEKITKVLLAQEDFAIGVGTTVQTRGGSDTPLTLNKVGLDWICATLAQLKALSADYTFAALEMSDGLKQYYYDSASTDTADDDLVVLPDHGVGRWIARVLYLRGRPLDTAVYTIENFSYTGLDWAATISDMHWSTDGLTMFVLTPTGRIEQYTAVNKNELGSMTYVGEYNLTTAPTSMTTPTSMTISPDGTKIYIAEANLVYELTMSTAWTLSTISYASVTYDTTTQTVTSEDIAFSTDGTKMYVANTTDIYQYALSTAWTLSTASYAAKTFDMTNSGMTAGTTFAFNSAGTKLFMTGATEDMYEHDVTVAWDIDDLSLTAMIRPTTPAISANDKITFNSTGTHLYILDISATIAKQFRSNFITLGL